MLPQPRQPTKSTLGINPSTRPHKQRRRRQRSAPASAASSANNPQPQHTSPTRSPTRAHPEQATAPRRGSARSAHLRVQVGQPALGPLRHVLHQLLEAPPRRVDQHHAARAQTLPDVVPAPWRQGCLSHRAAHRARIHGRLGGCAAYTGRAKGASIKDDAITAQCDRVCRAAEPCTTWEACTTHTHTVCAHTESVQMTGSRLRQTGVGRRGRKAARASRPPTRLLSAAPRAPPRPNRPQPNIHNGQVGPQCASAVLSQHPPAYLEK